MASYDVTQEALEDLFRIWEYTFDSWSETQADKYEGLLRIAFSTIAAKPFNLGKSYDLIYPGLRGYKVGRHIVFYIIRNNGRILIVRILHERMDFKHHLKQQ